MKVMYLFRTSAGVQQTARCYIPDDRSLRKDSQTWAACSSVKHPSLDLVRLEPEVDLDSQ
jgi:hypothetical protein